MCKTVLMIILVCSAALLINAQGQGNGAGSSWMEKYSAPVKWQRYNISDKQLSIHFPKMPIFIESSDPCGETDSRTYAAYAEEAIYQLIVYSKSKDKIPGWCEVKTKFGRKTIENRTAEFEGSVPQSTKFKIKEKETFSFSANSATYWVIEDLTNGKFLILAVSHRNSLKPNAEKFVQSLDFKNSTDGIEINNGSLQNLGDALTGKKEIVEMSPKEIVDSQNEALKIVIKPRANYTDAARRNEIQGTVALRVTFLANGGIGEVSTISGLPYGLTEQSIAAAKKLVFLPYKVKGENKSVTKQIQYSFTIY